MIKKVYAQPSLTTYGSVQKLTKALGNDQASDFFNVVGIPGNIDDITEVGQGSIDVTEDLGF